MQLPSVLIAAFAHTGWIHTTVARTLLAMGTDDRCQADILYVEKGMIDEARNFAVKHAIDNDYDYLLMIDHDNPCSKNPLDLLEARKDIVVFPTPTKDKNVLSWNIWPILKTGGLQKIEHGGTGCILLSRKALLGIPKPLFRTQLDSDGLVDHGEDIYFCNKATEHRFDIYTHTDYPCHHYKEVDLLST